MRAGGHDKSAAARRRDRRAGCFPAPAGRAANPLPSRRDGICAAGAPHRGGIVWGRVRRGGSLQPPGGYPEGPRAASRRRGRREGRAAGLQPPAARLRAEPVGRSALVRKSARKRLCEVREEGVRNPKAAEGQGGAVTACEEAAGGGAGRAFHSRPAAVHLLPGGRGDLRPVGPPRGGGRRRRRQAALHPQPRRRAPGACAPPARGEEPGRSDAGRGKAGGTLPSAPSAGRRSALSLVRRAAPIPRPSPTPMSLPPRPTRPFAGRAEDWC